MNHKIKFETVLEKRAHLDATGITIPFDVEKIFGAKRVPVVVTINGAVRLSTIIKMNSKYVVGVPKIFRAAARVAAGDAINVTLEKDTAKRSAEIPQDLADALEENALTDVFAKMSDAHQKECVNAVSEAKKAQTRRRRIEKMIETPTAKVNKTLTAFSRQRVSIN